MGLNIALKGIALILLVGTIVNFIIHKSNSGLIALIFIIGACAHLFGEEFKDRKVVMTLIGSLLLCYSLLLMGYVEWSMVTLSLGCIYIFFSSLGSRSTSNPSER